MVSSNRKLHEENRLSWNAATEAHNSHKGDQAAYFRAGGNKLYPEEREILGDVRGLSIVHLQCNSGQDTLSLAQMGARVTGVDISDVAIEFAQRLSAESGLPGTFQRMDVYDWLRQSGEAGEQFDVAFCSYGALCWLSDLEAWARGIATVLRPGARFVVVDYHPALMMFDEQWHLMYPYFGRSEHITWDDGVGDYVAETGGELHSGSVHEGVQNFHNPHPVHEFSWPLADIVTALIEGGLTLETLREYPYCNGFRPMPDMIELSGNRFTMAEGKVSVPCMFAIGARKPVT